MPRVAFEDSRDENLKIKYSCFEIQREMKQDENLLSTGGIVRWHLALYSAALPPISAYEPQRR
jgi:hypothetical protein